MWDILYLKVSSTSKVKGYKLVGFLPKAETDLYENWEN